MRVRSFSHVGITVSDFKKAVQFYWEVFGCPLVGVADTPPDRVRTFFGVDGERPGCKIGWIRAPGGATLEIFEFQPHQPPVAIPWNRVGLTHISFNVRNTQKWYDYLTAKGVECVSRPERSPRGHSFFFAKDFDGNLIEMIDLGRMYHVLKWLGPLGGWLFRRGMYKQYYRLGALALACQVLAGGALVAQRSTGASAWRQWGGPNRNFIVEARGLADKWPDTGPPVIWTRALGPGHSAILADDGLLFTMYRAGNGRTRQGPWEAFESVVALDSATGKTVWEHKYQSKIEDFNYGAGPHSTPLIVGDRLFAAGTNKQLFAFDKKSGTILWSHDLVTAFGAPSLLIRPVVKAGYGCSPLAYRDTIICSVGGPGQSVMAFRQADGRVAWKSGNFLVSEAAPVLITVGGREQVVIFGGGTINGLDPATGQVLWSHPHDPGNDLNINTPVWGPDNILFLSSGYKAGSRAIRLKPVGDVTEIEELWFSNKVRFMFLNVVRLGDYIYGSNGDLGPSFLTGVDVKTGQPAWQHRGIGRVSIVYADGKAFLMEEDGDLVLAKLAPEGVTVLSQMKLFETMSWSVPTLSGTTLYARDREKIVALDVGAK